MDSSITFVLDGAVTTIDAGSGLRPTTTVLEYLRSLPSHRGVKEGCAEGDCGACTVVLGSAEDGRMRYAAYDSCLLFLPMLQGKELLTVENVAGPDALHPVQEAMVATGGSQCGFCTPGFIMSLFALSKDAPRPSRDQVDDALSGNLCRCTGYRPIVEAAAQACAHDGGDHVAVREARTVELLASIPARSLRFEARGQSYHRPASLGEALTLLHARPGALVVGGGSDVALHVTKRHEILGEIVDISGLPELKACADLGGSLELGAGASITDVAAFAADALPALGEMLSVFGSRQIRNVATLGGNLGTASPIGDTLPVLAAYDATVIVEGLNRRREIPMREFITGYRRTLRRPDELVTMVRIPKPPPGVVVRSYKVSRRRDLDISTVSAGFRLERDGRGRVASVVLAYGGMAERMRRAEEAERFLAGKQWDRPTVEAAMELVGAAFTPISDARADAGTRTLAARNLLLKFWNDTKE